MKRNNIRQSRILSILVLIVALLTSVMVEGTELTVDSRGLILKDFNKPDVLLEVDQPKTVQLDGGGSLQILSQESSNGRIITIKSFGRTQFTGFGADVSLDNTGICIIRVVEENGEKKLRLSFVKGVGKLSKTSAPNKQLLKQYFGLATTEEPNLQPKVESTWLMDVQEVKQVEDNSKPKGEEQINVDVKNPKKYGQPKEAKPIVENAANKAQDKVNIIYPGDTLHISIYGSSNKISEKALVDQNGRISLKGIGGSIKVSGLTPNQVAEKLNTMLSNKEDETDVIVILQKK